MTRRIRRLVVIGATAAALGTGAIAHAAPASASGDLCAQATVIVEGTGGTYGGCNTLPIGDGSDCAYTNHSFGATQVGVRVCVPAVG